MSREKKDGRFINYYIDRKVYEELKRYADQKGQTMTTALERIIKKQLEKEKQNRRQRQQLID